MIIYYSTTISPTGEILSFSRTECIDINDSNKHEVSDSSGKKMIGMFVHEQRAKEIDALLREVFSKNLFLIGESNG